MKKAALKLDEEGCEYEVCPRDKRHRLNREPEGLYCEACRIHLQEPTTRERIRFRLQAVQP